MTLVPVEKLHTVWEWVEKGLYEIRNKGRQSWLPADVYVQLRHKAALLFVIEDAGFLIFQILPGDDFRGVLHIWCAWGDLKPHEQTLYQEIDAYAKTLGVARIRVYGRKGWGRRGWVKLTGYVFEREV